MICSKVVQTNAYVMCVLYIVQKPSLQLNYCLVIVNVNREVKIKRESKKYVFIFYFFSLIHTLYAYKQQQTTFNTYFFISF